MHKYFYAKLDSRRTKRTKRSGIEGLKWKSGAGPGRTASARGAFPSQRQYSDSVDAAWRNTPVAYVPTLRHPGLHVRMNETDTAVVLNHTCIWMDMTIYVFMVHVAIYAYVLYIIYVCVHIYTHTQIYLNYRSEW